MSGEGWRGVVGEERAARPAPRNGSVRKGSRPLFCVQFPLCKGVQLQLWLPAGQEPGQKGESNWHSVWLWHEHWVKVHGTWYPQRFGGNGGRVPRAIGTNSQCWLPGGQGL